MLIPTIFREFPQAVPTRGILHVGAHTCEEGPLYHSLGMDDESILWIDANEDCAPSDAINANYLVATLSDTDHADAILHLTSNRESSSILALKEHLTEHPHVTEIGQRAVKTITLDTLLRDHEIPADRFDFLNMDVQGAELLVLKGATEVLPHIRAIYTEVNEGELYEGCSRLPEMDAFLTANGFQRVRTEMTKHRWGDALYLRVAASSSPSK